MGKGVHIQQKSSSGPGSKYTHSGHKTQRSFDPPPPPPQKKVCVRLAPSPVRRRSHRPPVEHVISRASACAAGARFWGLQRVRLAVWRSGAQNANFLKQQRPFDGGFGHVCLGSLHAVCARLRPIAERGRCAGAWPRQHVQNRGLNENAPEIMNRSSRSKRAAEGVRDYDSTCCTAVGANTTTCCAGPAIHCTSGGGTQRGRRWTACGQRRVDSKNSQTTPPTTSTSSIRQLLGAADAQTAHHATFSTVPTRQLLGSANAETTPARAPAAAANRTQRSHATCEGENG